MRKTVKIFSTCLITGILFILFDMLFAILISPIFSLYSGLTVFKIPPDIMAGMVFDIVNGFILVGVFSVIYTGLPGTGWRKGLNYGLIVGLLRVVMMSFSVIVMYSVPLGFVVATLITGYIEIVILCVILSTIYEKLKA